MFVMISAILLAWAPTAAYAGVVAQVHIETEDRKGNLGLNFDCTESNFTIEVRGKGDITFGGGNPRIPNGTGSIDVEFNLDTEKITLIQFNKNSGSFNGSFSGAINPFIIIDAKIGSTTICGFDIPKGTTSLTLEIAD